MSKYCAVENQSSAIPSPGERFHRITSRSGSGVGQRPEEQRARDAEDRGVGADAEGQREHGGERDAGRTGQEAQRVTRVLPERHGGL